MKAISQIGNKPPLRRRRSPITQDQMLTAMALVKINGGSISVRSVAAVTGGSHTTIARFLRKCDSRGITIGGRQITVRLSQSCIRAIVIMANIFITNSSELSVRGINPATAAILLEKLAFLFDPVFGFGIQEEDVLVIIGDETQEVES